MKEEVVTGMDAVITSLTSALSAANLWGIVGSVVPFLAISVLFGLGFYLVKRILNKVKRAKGGM
jgi:hypothetical protein